MHPRAEVVFHPGGLLQSIPIGPNPLPDSLDKVSRSTKAADYEAASREEAPRVAFRFGSAASSSRSSAFARCSFFAAALTAVSVFAASSSALGVGDGLLELGPGRHGWNVRPATAPSKGQGPRRRVSPSAMSSNAATRSTSSQVIVPPVPFGIERLARPGRGFSTALACRGTAGCELLHTSGKRRASPGSDALKVVVRDSRPRSLRPALSRRSGL
jgi:hypothetical protein